MFAVFRTSPLLVLLTISGGSVAAEVNVSKPIAQRGMPVRVHVVEDFETDIEQRWWLAGKPVRENVPESVSTSVANTRCCRAGETKNFDRDQADQSQVWKAVIFNPVPGPPMGPRTRLSFRYRLAGTDSLRVQLYTLSRDYHRCLTLAGLPQEQWQSATVDMTAARRPDGTGGPLSEDERIDDIQFYVPPAADLLIDDIVLYEEAAEGEQRPFPRRIVFTGWFDTGEQGREWPGDFEIVPHQQPLTWDAAKSVIHTPTGASWIRVQLRGLRPLSRNTEVRFRYHLAGSEQLGIALVNSGTGQRHAAEVRGVKAGGWEEATVALAVAKDVAFADELHFFAGNDAVLLVDDVLVYEPGG
jgi:hypothetical protein